MTFKRKLPFGNSDKKAKEKILTSSEAPSVTSSSETKPETKPEAKQLLEKDFQENMLIDGSKTLEPHSPNTPKRASRFYRQSQVGQADEGSESNAPSNFSEQPNWSLWGIDQETFEPLDHFQKTTCPKCNHKTLLASTNHAFDHCGVFLCLRCQFHGQSRLTPKTFRGTFTSILQQYLSSSIHDKELWFKNNLSDVSQEALCDLPSALGYALPQTTSATEATKCSLVLSLHTLCLDENQKLRDVRILKVGTSFYGDENVPQEKLTWFRYDLPAYPLLWGEVNPQDKIIITQNDLDAGSLIHAGFSNVTSIPPDLNLTLTQDQAWRTLEFMEEKLQKATEVVFVFPQGSSALEDELARRIGKEKCFRTRMDGAFFDIENQEDAEEINNEVHEEDIDGGEEKTSSEFKTIQEAINANGLSWVQTLIDVASPFPVAGLHELADLDERFEDLYSTGLVPGAETGWPTMDMHYTVKTGQWTVVTGIPGHGKSTWLDALLVNLATLHGWRFGLFSPENQPIERHFASLMEKKLQKPFSKGPTPRITPSEKNACKSWLNDKFKIILPDEDDGLWTLEAVLNLAKTLVYRYGIRGLVIDPWNELDHARQSHVSETTYISECLTKIRRFARLYDVHIWIVAHPTKLEKKSDGKYPVATPYDISGGAHWRNKADVAISVYRNVDEADYDVSDVYVQKIRFREIGRLGMVSLRSDVASGYYIDDIDQSKRQYSLSNGSYLSSSALRIPHPRHYSTHKIPLVGNF